MIAAAVLLGACADDAVSPTEPGSQYPTIELNTTSAPVHLTLGATATITPVVDPAASAEWDLGFTSTEVSVNGGASGPAGVKAYCLCANAGLTLAQVEALDGSDGAGAFDAVTAASIPDAASFELDAATQAISDWYSYNPQTHAIATTGNVWGIRLASTAGDYAKFHVTAIPAPGQSNAGPVTLEWATQTGAAGTMGANHTLVVDLSSGAKVYVNLSTGTTSASPSDMWDVALEGYTISVNGGASGSGDVAAVALVPSSFYASYDDVTTIPVGAAGIPSTAFTTDGAGGAFFTNAPYRYDATTHQVWPTLDVYLVKRGTAVYKVQVISYYSTGGTFGVLTLRYAKLTD